MWARAVEVMLGVWLLVSPFVFRHPDGEWALWVNDYACALVVITLAVLSFWSKTRRAHLGLLAVALWLVGFGWAFSAAPALPGAQNDLMVGLLLLMFAIVPSEASLPPPTAIPAPTPERHPSRRRTDPEPRRDAAFGGQPARSR